jgi:prevent-host-death family protein
VTTIDVGIRELKEHLSEYLDRAAAGEVSRVTDHGRPKAILAPLPGVSNLNTGLTDKSITAPSSEKAPHGVARVRVQQSISDVLRDDRGE